MAAGNEVQRMIQQVFVRQIEHPSRSRQHARCIGWATRHSHRRVLVDGVRVERPTPRSPWRICIMFPTIVDIDQYAFQLREAEDDPCSAKTSACRT